MTETEQTEVLKALETNVNDLISKGTKTQFEDVEKKITDAKAEVEKGNEDVKKQFEDISKNFKDYKEKVAKALETESKPKNKMEEKMAKFSEDMESATKNFRETKQKQTFLAPHEALGINVRKSFNPLNIGITDGTDPIGRGQVTRYSATTGIRDTGFSPLDPFDALEMFETEVITGNSSNIPYYDRVAKNSTIGIKQEGQTGGSVTTELEQRILTLRNYYGDDLISNESLSDMNDVLALTGDTIREEIQKKYNDEFINGTGGDTSHNSLKFYGTAFDDTDFRLGTGSTVYTWDLMKAMLAQLRTKNFVGNMFLMNVLDYWELITQKDDNKNYIQPTDKTGVPVVRLTETTANALDLGYFLGVPIILTNYVNKGDLFALDSRVVKNYIKDVNESGIDNVGREHVTTGTATVYSNIRFNTRVHFTRQEGIVFTDDISQSKNDMAQDPA